MAFDLALVENKTQVDEGKVAQLASTVKADDYNSIAKFGTNVAESISKCADKMLQNDAASEITRVQELMETINKLMTSFDKNDLEPKEDKTFLDKLMKKAKRDVERVVSKYNNMGKDIEKIYVNMKTFTSDIEKSNQGLVEEFNAQVEFYKNLKEHIAAMEQVQSTIQTSDESVMVLIANKLNDLRAAEAVTVQNIMMLKVREFNNLSLSRKLDNAFIITLPLFKQKLNEAIEIKKTAIQAKALSLLDEKTNQMIKENATSAIETAKQVARMANSSSIKMETLEQTYNTILNGIRDVQQIQEQTIAEEKSNGEKLKQLKLQLEEKKEETVEALTVE